MEQPKKGSRFPKFQERFRKLQGEMSNTEFADFLGITRQTIGFYLNGNRIPDILCLAQISRRCNVSADWLIGTSDVETINTDIKATSKFTGLSEASIHYLTTVNESLDGSELPREISPLQVLNDLLCSTKYQQLLDLIGVYKNGIDCYDVLAEDYIARYEKGEYTKEKERDDFRILNGLESVNEYTRFKIIDQFTKIIDSVYPAKYPSIIEVDAPPEECENN